MTKTVENKKQVIPIVSQLFGSACKESNKEMAGKK
jgi:hypothetical protein